jgi:hypothetical protein
MVHLRIIAPANSAEQALALLTGSRYVCNVIHLPGAAQKPDGDLILCDVARREVSVLIADLRKLRVPEEGSITMQMTDTDISTAADSAQAAAHKLPFGDAVVWEDIEARTSQRMRASLRRDRARRTRRGDAELIESPPIAGPSPRSGAWGSDSHEGSDSRSSPPAQNRLDPRRRSRVRQGKPPSGRPPHRREERAELDRHR